MAPLEHLGKVMMILTCQLGQYGRFYAQIDPTTVEGQTEQSSQRRGYRFHELQGRL
jgi:hypothetical protein